MSKLSFSESIDSNVMACENRRVLEIRYEIAESLGPSALAAIDAGEYLTDDGWVNWSAAVKAAEAAKMSIPPDATLPHSDQQASDETLVSVVNRTTLAASRALGDEGPRWFSFSLPSPAM